MELDEESRYITTFSTHVGLQRYKRLNFGVTSAAEIFQNTIAETLAGINNCMNISDDILVYGTTQSEHDITLTACSRNYVRTISHLTKISASSIKTALNSMDLFSVVKSFHQMIKRF